MKKSVERRLSELEAKAKIATETEQMKLLKEYLSTLSYDELVEHYEKYLASQPVPGLDLAGLSNVELADLYMKLIR